MAFWEQTNAYYNNHETYHVKTLNGKFSQEEMAELAEEGQQLWSGIANVSKVNVETRDWGQGGINTHYTTTVELALEGKDGPETYTLQYGSEYGPEKRFEESKNIAFIGTKKENELSIIMIGEPADLETIQSKIKTAIENGQAIIKMNKLKEKLQVADAFLIKPLKAAYAELRESWENVKRERKEREAAAVEAAKAEREAKNNRPTGMYSQPEQTNRTNDITK